MPEIARRTTRKGFIPPPGPGPSGAARVRSAGQPIRRRVFAAVRARDGEGRYIRHPALAPDALHAFMVGRAVAFHDTFARDLGWTVGAPVSARSVSTRS